MQVLELHSLEAQYFITLGLSYIAVVSGFKTLFNDNIAYTFTYNPPICTFKLVYKTTCYFIPKNALVLSILLQNHPSSETTSIFKLHINSSIICAFTIKA